MKHLILIFVLILSSVAFGQSKKKINERLAKELVVEKKTYDSLYTLYKNGLAELVSERLQAGSLLYKSLRNINYSIEEQRYKLNQLKGVFYTLKMAGNAPTNIYNDTLPNYYELKAGVESMMNFSFSEKEPIMPLNLSETKKMDERNVKMSKQLDLYRQQSKVLQEELGPMNTTKLQFVEFNSTSNQIFQEYSDEFNRLSEIYILKVRELSAIRKEFQEKGPKGYSSAYFQAFPDVFPGKSCDIPKSNDELSVEMVDPSMAMNAVSSDYDVIDSESDTIYDVVDTPAEYPGGRDSLVAFLSSNIQYPDFALQNKIGGKSYVKFIISENGKVTNAKVVKGVLNCKECDREAVRVIQSMPDWKPGKNQEKNVNSWYTLPIIFRTP